MLGAKVIAGVLAAGGTIGVCCLQELSVTQSNTPQASCCPPPASAAKPQGTSAAPRRHGGCCAPPAVSADAGAATLEKDAVVTELDDTLQPLIDDFNKGAGKPRFVALLSSTCPACVFGAKAVQASILDAYPDADMAVQIVWIDMLPTDGRDAVVKIARMFSDPRVKQYYDVDRLAGRAISSHLLYENAGPAWDIYVFFDGEAVWGETPPKPADWMHQLSGGKRADPKRYRAGDALSRQLKASMQPILARADSAAAPASVTLRVEGMTCGGCMSAVRAALLKVPGVEDATVSLQQKQASVRLDPSTPPAVAALIEAIQKAGFRAREESQER